MTSAADGLCTLDDRELVLHFESIGDNCELGLLQRRVGAEPLGLLRFAGAPLRSVIRALENRFQGIADPLAVRVHEENNEFMVKLNRYDVYYHTHLKPGEITPAALHEQQCRTVTFLTNKLIADLEQPSKILVFRQNESVLASDLLDLRIALSAYGPSTLLWVQEACSGHPPGSIAVSDARLIIGYVNKLAPREDVPQLHAPSWLSVLRKAYAVWLRPENERMAAGREAAAQVRRIDLSFGADGNAGPYLGAGWSGPEAGYQWAIGESSVLTIPSLGAADQYWLEMDVIPFVSPPILPRQRLDVVVNDAYVHGFDPLPRASVGCVVPGSLVPPGNVVTITLNHPLAASPAVVAGGSDDRLLAVSFSRLAFVAV